MLAAFFLSTARVRRNQPLPEPTVFDVCLTTSIAYAPPPGNRLLRLRVRVVPPRTAGQTLVHRGSTPLPTDSGDDGSGPWLEWRLVEPREGGRIEIQQCVQRRHHDLVHPALEETLPFDLSTWTRPDSMHPSRHPGLSRFASNIGGDSPQSIAMAALDSVVGRLEYGGFQSRDQGALKAFLDGRGDCSEFSDLLVTVLRARGLAARTVRGVTPGDLEPQLHQWVEILLPDRGWTEMDPLWAKTQKLSARRVPGLRLALSEAEPSAPYADQWTDVNWWWEGVAPEVTVTRRIAPSLSAP